MNKFAAFLLGLAVGVGGSAFFVKKWLIPDLKEEIENEMYRDREDDLATSNDIRASYDDVSEANEQEFISNSVNKPDVKVETFNDVQAVKVDYSRYSKSYSEDTKREMDEETANMETTEIGGTDPYVIDANSYDEYSNYKSHSFELYSDGVVIDSETEEILDADPEQVFGSTAMDILRNGEEPTVFVRDDSKKSDYCIERIDFPFDGNI